MKKLLFTIAGLSQVMLVMAQVPPMRSMAGQTQGAQPIQKAAAYNGQNQTVYQKAARGWLIVDVEGSMPTDRIPGLQGMYQAVQEKQHQEK
jgi:hypothetical protein